MHNRNFQKAAVGEAKVRENVKSYLDKAANLIPNYLAGTIREQGADAPMGKDRKGHFILASDLLEKKARTKKTKLEIAIEQLVAAGFSEAQAKEMLEKGPSNQK